MSQLYIAKPNLLDSDGRRLFLPDGGVFGRLKMPSNTYHTTNPLWKRFPLWLLRIK